MSDKKNISNSNTSKETLKKSLTSRPRVDGLYKKKKIIPINKEDLLLETDLVSQDMKDKKNPSVDDDRRLFLKVAGVAGLGLAASTLFPRAADAYVTGGTPTSNVVGVKDATDSRVNPATEETLSTLLAGQGVTKFTTSLSSSGTVITPTSGKKIRVYANRFSLTADATSVSFRFTAGGTDHEKYVSPKTGGLYGANNHPNYIEGGVNEVLYCVISGTTTVQINIDYLEV